ncbi:MAG: hypothetical protein KF775_01440 [Cyclobacteriaceae bacterium]|nr:hypothetical protein [Cyclobacteriaceae bacterium]
MFKFELNAETMKMMRVLSLVVVAGAFLTFTGCKKGGSDPKPITEVQFNKLNKTWKVQSVTFDNTDRTSEYTAANFQLVIGGTVNAATYTTSGRPFPSPWKGSGTWTFGANPETQIIRDKDTADALNLTYAVTESTLTISFQFSGTGYTSRTESVQGPWVFTFTL